MFSYSQNDVWVWRNKCEDDKIVMKYKLRVTRTTGYFIGINIRMIKVVMKYELEVVGLTVKVMFIGVDDVKTSCWLNRGDWHNERKILIMFIKTASYWRSFFLINSSGLLASVMVNCLLLFTPGYKNVDLCI